MSVRKRSYKDLEVWQKSVDISVSVYTFCKTLPHEERYGISSQMTRSAVSVASNIAEGAARSSSKDFIRFLVIARGSLAELDTQLLIANKVYKVNTSHLSQDIEIVGKMLSGLINYLRDKDSN